MYARFDETSGSCNRNGSVIRTMGSNSAELYHYGVKGMKWRKRVKKNLDKVNGDDTPSFGDSVVRLQEKRRKYLNGKSSPVAKSKAQVESVKKTQEKKAKKILDDAKAQAKAKKKENTWNNLKTGAKATSSSVKLKKNVGKSIDKAVSGRKFWTTVGAPYERAVKQIEENNKKKKKP